MHTIITRGRQRALAALLLLLALLIGAQPSVAQTTAPGLSILAAPASGAYVGPGDVTTGWIGWYSCAFAFSAATRGSLACNVCNSVGANCVDVSSNAITGVVPTPAPGGTSCTNITPCIVDIAYDQSGSGHPLSNLKSNTSSPQLNIAALGASQGLSIGLNLATSVGLSGSIGSPARPFSFSVVYKTAPATTGTGQHILEQAGGADLNLGNLNGMTNIARMFVAPSGFNGTATDGVFHAAQASYRSGSSGQINVDGTTASGSLGTNTFTTNFDIGIGSGGSGNTSLNGIVMEAGILSSDSSGAVATNLNANQHSRYGF